MLISEQYRSITMNEKHYMEGNAKLTDLLQQALYLLTMINKSEQAKTMLLTVTTSYQYLHHILKIKNLITSTNSVSTLERTDKHLVVSTSFS